MGTCTIEVNFDGLSQLILTSSSSLDLLLLMLLKRDRCHGQRDYTVASSRSVFIPRPWWDRYPRLRRMKHVTTIIVWILQDIILLWIYRAVYGQLANGMIHQVPNWACRKAAWIVSHSSTAQIARRCMMNLTLLIKGSCLRDIVIELWSTNFRVIKRYLMLLRLWGQLFLLLDQGHGDFLCVSYVHPFLYVILSGYRNRIGLTSVCGRVLLNKQ